MAVVVGQRVLDKQGFKGTVRYVGPVATSKSAETVYAGEAEQRENAIRLVSWLKAEGGKSVCNMYVMPCCPELTPCTRAEAHFPYKNCHISPSPFSCRH